MFSTTLVVFREILEVALILGVILAATRGLPGRTLWINIGITVGIAGSILVAIFAGAISNAAEGMGQELFNALVLLTAAVVIAGTALWMKKHAREMTQHIKQVGQAVVRGDLPLYSIAVIIALAVLREGSEIVLFTYSMIASGQSISTILMGSLIGLAAGTMVGLALYYGLLKISTRHIFQVTTWLLILLAAGMASMAAKYLAAAGYFETLTKTLWDTSHILSDQSVFGQAMQTLFGYTARPMEIQMIFYGVTIAALSTALIYMNRNSAKKSVAVG